MANGRGDSLRPLFAFLEGKPVAYLELVAAGRSLAHSLISRGVSTIACDEDEWAGVWDLERLTDADAVDWGLWVAKKARPTKS
jgi:hypothetical protein